MKQDVLLKRRDDETFKGVYDLVIEDKQIKAVDGMETALIVSIFTDARASSDNVATPERRKGWVGDILTLNIQRTLGSTLWVYKQSRITQKILNQIKESAQIANKWFVQDGISRKIDVGVLTDSPRGIAILIDIQTPSGATQSYSVIWRATSGDNLQ